jgi:hypothetical protein
LFGAGLDFHHGCLTCCRAVSRGWLRDWKAQRRLRHVG